MKLLRLSFLLVIAIALASCGDDDDAAPTCTQATWVDTYSGTITCNGIDQAVTVEIIASGTDAVIIKYETINVEAEYDPITPDGCNLDVSNSGGGLSVSISGMLDGDQLTITETIGAGGTSTTCNISATRT